MIPHSHYTYNIMKEEWIIINRKCNKPNVIVAVSNTGKTPWNKGLRSTALTKHYKDNKIENQPVQGG